MKHTYIIRHLCLKYPSEVIHEITTATVISEIVRRLAEEALELSAEDLKLAMDEVRAALEHHLDEREYIEIGLNSWEILRNL